MATTACQRQSSNEENGVVAATTRVRARPISCNDGDTCRVRTETGQSLTVRLGGIDAPESDQEYGKEAAVFLESLIRNQDVEIECNGTSFSRQTCVVYKGNLNSNEEMVRSGLAWDYPRHSGGRYAPYEIQARQERRGLWAGEKIESPYCRRTLQNYPNSRSAQICRDNPQYQN